jgi:hypothetical protein
VPGNFAETSVILIHWFILLKAVHASVLNEIREVATYLQICFVNDMEWSILKYRT